jgi:serine protease Do
MTGAHGAAARRAVWLVMLTVVGSAGPMLMSVPACAQTVREVFQTVAPSVVVVRGRGRDVTMAGQTRYSATGSGVLVSADGQVMTASHVVHALDEITVEFLGGETVTAKVVASEPAADLSLLKLDRVPPGSRFAATADSDTVQVGDQVVIVGAPYGLGHSLSAGYISARWAPNTVHRTMPMAEFFQTDAVINTGNSGGPMFNMAGEVIGIVSHNISRSGGSEGLGFVVTLNTARALLLETRSFWSGLEGLSLTDELADLLNLPDRSPGFIVKTIAKGSPADRVGLRGATQIVTISGQEVPLGGDIILAVEGIPASVANADRIRQALNHLTPGSSFRVRILRAGEVLELTGRMP